MFNGHRLSSDEAAPIRAILYSFEARQSHRLKNLRTQRNQSAFLARIFVGSLSNRANFCLSFRSLFSKQANYIAKILKVKNNRRGEKSQIFAPFSLLAKDRFFRRKPRKAANFDEFRLHSTVTY